jgi:ABC-type branched-subunit amino acid transport system substrate-binding protein
VGATVGGMFIHHRLARYAMSQFTTRQGAIAVDRRQVFRHGAAVVSVAALIAAGGYGATQTFGPDAFEPAPAVTTPSTVVAPSHRTLMELRESLAAQYGGSRSTSGDAIGSVGPSAERLREIRDGLALQYGGR